MLPHRSSDVYVHLVNSDDLPAAKDLCRPGRMLELAGLCITLKSSVYT